MEDEETAKEILEDYDATAVTTDDEQKKEVEALLSITAAETPEDVKEAMAKVSKDDEGAR